ncbi:hypothetical protein [Xenorhabdus sp. KJ12.1]|uniref:hypothetical protein n=1 Tax=Xenorhabdus sp. KJ12.1 TaxID=1851571 RepID=UPI000C03EF72|nr:hypothetical protein [Xenorhabdus sp. KJ12.1]PHM72206.1 hypothetical protein Xekj_00484 [Xenorhabdus sp. KJ12.1]
MTKFINLTTYLASNEQRDMGVIDVDGNVASALTEYLVFHSPPEKGEMLEKANVIADIASNLSIEHDTSNVLINAKSFFIPTLVAALQKRGLTPFITFAQRSTRFQEGKIMSKDYVHKSLVDCTPES